LHDLCEAAERSVCTVAEIEREEVIVHKRTAQEFVEDLVSELRNWNYVRSVAVCTRWNERISEVREEYKKLRSRRKEVLGGKDK
jgi:3-methyladenine DNA glycosylase AlkD